MGLVVTGISQTADVAAVETALGAAGLSLDHLSIIEPGDDARPITSAQSSLAASNVGPIETGTGVPGLTGGSSTAGSGVVYFRDDALAGRLADLDIPDDELDNYLEALAAGRSVVAYYAKDETIDAVENAFRTAGLAKIKRF